jgi:hypothetical protein
LGSVPFVLSLEPTPLDSLGGDPLAEAMHNWNRLARAMDLAFNAHAEEA